MSFKSFVLHNMSLSDVSTKSYHTVVAPPAVQAKNWISEKPVTASHTGVIVLEPGVLY